MKAKLPYLISLAILLTYALLCIYYYPRLPERVASHYGADGRADAWSSKAALMMSIGAALVLMAALGLVLAKFTGVLPTRWINLPHKEYWLSAPRREETLLFLRRYLAWLLIPVQVFILLTAEMTFAANAAGRKSLPRAFYPLLIVTVAVTLALSFYPLLRFRKPEP